MKLKNCLNNTAGKDFTPLPDTKKLPNWSQRELEAFRPPKKQPVAEWADENIFLDNNNPIPGRWRTERTPYLEMPLNCFSDKKIRQINMCAGSQLGKTMFVFITICHTRDQNPSPGLIVYPSKDDGEAISELRLQPFIKNSPTVEKKFQENKSKKLELKFTDSFLRIVGAHTPNQLSSFPMKYVWADEIGKFPLYSGSEASPISLAKERTKNFNDSKVVLTSTPVLEIGPMWTALMDSDVILQYYVPCPHCGEFQVLEFKQIKWPDSLKTVDSKTASKMVVNLAKYHCKFCEGVIEDRHKLEILNKGEWRPVFWDREKEWKAAEWPEYEVTEIGFHISSLYSPFLKFGQIAKEFLKSMDDLGDLQNFINSWLAEPWMDKGNKMKSDIVMEKQSSHERGEVPGDTVFMTAGVDVQKDHFWYTVRAWGEGITSWLVEYGRAETWNEIEEVLINRRYKNAIGQDFVVRLAFIDSGYRTDEVYQFCSMFPEACVPSKGSNTRLKAPVNVSAIEKNGFYNLKLYNVDTHYFKDFIAGRLGRDVEAPGSWMIFKDCPREFADQVTAEQKITRQERGKSGKITDEWIKISSHAQNHLLDCSVYDAAAAEICGVRYIQKPIVKKVRNEAKKKDWIPNKNWFSRR